MYHSTHTPQIQLYIHAVYTTIIENFLLHGFSKDDDWVCLYTSSAGTPDNVQYAS